MVPRCPLEVVSEMRPYTPSTEGSTEDVLKCVVEAEVTGPNWPSISSAGKKDDSVKKVSKYMCLRQRMKQAHSGVVEFRMRAARYKMFSLLSSDLIARWG